MKEKTWTGKFIRCEMNNPAVRIRQDWKSRKQKRPNEKSDFYVNADLDFIQEGRYQNYI